MKYHFSPKSCHVPHSTFWFRYASISAKICLYNFSRNLATGGWVQISFWTYHTVATIFFKISGKSNTWLLRTSDTQEQHVYTSNSPNIHFWLTLVFISPSVNKEAAPRRNTWSNVLHFPLGHLRSKNRIVQSNVVKLHCPLKFQIKISIN